jgi:hypothetical protein
MYTGRDVYRMLVRERGWSADKYEEWLGGTLARSLLVAQASRPVPAVARGSGPRKARAARPKSRRDV